MIQANELRIGNKIISNVVYEGQIKTFERFNDDLNVVFFSDGSLHGIGEYLKDCKPIPLTEQILLKCGFYLNESAGIYKIVSCRHLCINKENMNYCDSDYFGGIDDIISIQYLHQLQNLYFALTGKELEISL